MQLYRRPGGLSVKADQSPPTEAGLLADRIIRAGLEKAYPEVPSRSEPGGAAPSDGCLVFLVAPLGGTCEFSDRNGECIVNIAAIAFAALWSGLVAVEQLIYRLRVRFAIGSRVPRTVRTQR